jgi:hypothetical protein
MQTEKTEEVWSGGRLSQEEAMRSQRGAGHGQKMEGRFVYTAKVNAQHPTL